MTYMLSENDVRISNATIRNLLKEKYYTFSKSETLASTFATTGHVLPTEAVKGFMKILGDNSELQGMVTYKTFTGDQIQLTTADMPKRTLTRTIELNNHRIYREISMVQRTLTPVWFDAKFKITDQSLNVNLEGKSLDDVMAELMALAMRQDIEKLLIRGDKNGPLTNEDEDFTGYASSKVMVDDMYRLVDGLIALAKTYGTELDVSGYTNKYFNPHICKKMLEALSASRSFKKKDMKWWCSSIAEGDFHEHLEDKGTDFPTILNLILKSVDVKYHSLPIMGLPWFENYPKHVTTHEFTSGGTVTLSYAPSVSGSIKITANTTGTYFTPYTDDSDFTFDETTNVVEHTGTDSTMPTGEEMNITVQGSDIVVMMPPENMWFAANEQATKVALWDIPEDWCHVYASRISVDAGIIVSDDIIYATGLQNKS